LRPECTTSRYCIKALAARSCLFITNQLRGIQMAQRGKVLRDTSNGKGLISANGTQYEFALEGGWKSDISPKVGMVVEFELNAEGNISSASAVPENQLAKEQAELVMKAAKEKGMAALSSASARVGTSVLVAWGALAIAWFFLDMVSISMGSNNSQGITFWSYLSMANNGFERGISLIMANQGGDKGIFALFAILALVGPALSQFWKDSKSHLGNCLPLALMLGLPLTAYISFHSKMSDAQKMFGGNQDMEKFASEMLAEMMKSVHIGMGGYVAVAASLYLAFIGLKRFLVAKAQA
jgi:hypothetical protein